MVIGIDELYETRILPKMTELELEDTPQNRIELLNDFVQTIENSREPVQFGVSILLWMVQREINNQTLIILRQMP